MGFIYWLHTTQCVTVNKLLMSSEPQFYQLQNGIVRKMEFF